MFRAYVRSGPENLEFSVANCCHNVCTFLGAYSSTSILSVSADCVVALPVRMLKKNFLNTKYDLMFPALYFRSLFCIICSFKIVLAQTNIDPD